MDSFSDDVKRGLSIQCYKCAGLGTFQMCWSRRRVSMTAALKCFRCGKYTPEGAGSIIPCYDYNQTDLRECRSSDKFCLKYLNKGIIVRDCVEKCESGIHELSEFFCCEEDGCNGAPIIQVEWTVWILLFILIIFKHEMT